MLVRCSLLMVPRIVIPHPRPQLFYGSCIALVRLLLQALTGALRVAMHLGEGAFILHVTHVSKLFAVQCYIGG